MKFWQKCSRRESEEQGKRKQFPFWLLGTGLGVLFLALGNEQFEEIYRKAVMICLECIGIG